MGKVAAYCVRMTICFETINKIFAVKHTNT